MLASEIFEWVVFYSLAASIVLSGLAMITTKNAVHAALYMVLAFTTTGMLWVFMSAEFLGITLILVYVGAVAVLFLFVVMMLDVNFEPLREGFIRYLPLGLIVAGLFVLQLVMVSGDKVFKAIETPEPKNSDYNNTLELGRVLYTEYVYAFEIASVILLVSIIAAITLTHRKREGAKYQNIHKQVMTRKENRIEVVKIDSMTETNTSQSNDVQEEK